MVIEPVVTAVSNPVALTVAIEDGGLIVKLLLDVTFWVELSAKVAVTVSCSVAPELRIKVGLTGEICSVLRTRSVTVRFVFPLMPLSEALIEVVPDATVVATPPVVIVAIPVWDEAQVTALALVMSAVDPSEYVPVAVKFTVFETPETEEFAGVTAIDCSTGAVTFRVADAVEVLSAITMVAVIVSSPSASAVARPLLAGSLLTVAYVPGFEVQVESKVKSWVVLSEKVPRTVNWVVKPLETEEAAGVIAMDVTVALDTVNV
jgi:hypothetical protein